MATFAEMVTAADRAAMAALGGVTVTYAPAVGDPVPVTGMFDAEYVLAKGSPDAGVGVTGPAVFLRIEDLPLDPEEDEPTLTIDGVDYTMVGPPQPDGMGGVLLVLRALA